jgi:hypothetical protein
VAPLLAEAASLIEKETLKFHTRCSAETPETEISPQIL